MQLSEGFHEIDLLQDNNIYGNIKKSWKHASMIIPLFIR